jgi:hypothetical protein
MVALRIKKLRNIPGSRSYSRLTTGSVELTISTRHNRNRPETCRWTYASLDFRYTPDGKSRRIQSVVAIATRKMTVARAPTVRTAYSNLRRVLYLAWALMSAACRPDVLDRCCERRIMGMRPLSAVSMVTASTWFVACL